MRHYDDVLVLGIESTAHTFGVGIASSKGLILSNINSTYVPSKGGIHPREAAEHHSKVASQVVLKALEVAHVNLEELDGIAVALGPGLGPCLRVGATLARALSLMLNKPLIPVNHAVAHIEIGRLDTGFKDPLVVYVSGGNTLIAAFNEGRYRVFGETLDIALGNCIDVFARKVGLGFPGVPEVEGKALSWKEFVKLPYTVKGQDISCSGLLTAALRKVNEGRRLEDICFSLLETAYCMLVEVTERALVHTSKREVLLTGGVARSKLLSEKLKLMAKEHGAKFKAVRAEYAGDNGAMIAYTGALALKHGIMIKVKDGGIRPRWRIEEVEVPWRREE
ncbi:MAG: UGMP family protein [Thermofilum sp. ex4484_15]|nr:MAG: UGMP family protein [Thermofilum sp. ex4484_15]